MNLIPPSPSPERNAWVYAVSAAAYSGGHETVKVFNQVLSEALRLADENKAYKKANEFQCSRLVKLEEEMDWTFTHPVRFLFRRILDGVWRFIAWT